MRLRNSDDSSRLLNFYTFVSTSTHVRDEVAAIRPVNFRHDRRSFTTVAQPVILINSSRYVRGPYEGHNQSYMNLNNYPGRYPSLP